MDEVDFSQCSDESVTGVKRREYNQLRGAGERNDHDHQRDQRSTALQLQHRYLPPELLPRPPVCHSRGTIDDTLGRSEVNTNPGAGEEVLNADDGDYPPVQFYESEVSSPALTEDEKDRPIEGQYSGMGIMQNGSAHGKEWTEARIGQDESMAELILTALQRKDDLLREQANSLQQRDLDLAHLQGEVAGLREEKRLLLNQLRNCDEVSPAPNGVTKGSSKQKLDIISLSAENEKLVTQLKEARVEAEKREAKYTADLQYIYDEVQEFTTLINEVQLLRAALQEAEKKFNDERELRKRLEFECRRAARESQESLAREREEHQKELRRYQQLHKDAEAAHREAADEVCALQRDLHQLTVDHAALTVTSEVNEKRVADIAGERARLQTSLEAAKQETALLRTSMEKLNKRGYPQMFSEGDCDERRGEALFERLDCEVEQNVLAVQRHLEDMVVVLERRINDSEERERLLCAERDRLRTQLQQLTVSSRKELLEHQQIADERASVHNAHLQQLHSALAHQRLLQEKVEEKAQTALMRSQERLQEAFAELEHLRHEREAATREENHRQALLEGQMARVLQTLRNKLNRRDVECQELKRNIKRLEERIKSKAVVPGFDSPRQLSSPLPREAKEVARVTSLTHSCPQNEDAKPWGGLAATKPGTSWQPNSDPYYGELPATQSDACGHNFSEGKLKEAVARVAKLEEQLQAKSNKYSSILKDRKHLIHRVEWQRQKHLERMETLEREQREALRKLETAHRRRMNTVSSETLRDWKQRESAIERGVASVVVELLEFIHELESYATVVNEKYIASIASRNAEGESRRFKLSCDSPLCDAASKREDALRAACDDITRNFLGVNGGWEALCQSTSLTFGDTTLPFAFGKAIPQSMRRRLRHRITDYLKLQFCSLTPDVGRVIGTSTSAGEQKREVNNFYTRKRRTVSFGLIDVREERTPLRDEPYTSANGKRNRNAGTLSSGPCEESLIEVLMECVRYIFQA